MLRLKLKSHWTILHDLIICFLYIIIQALPDNIGCMTRKSLFSRTIESVSWARGKVHSFSFHISHCFIWIHVWKILYTIQSGALFRWCSIKIFVDMNTCIDFTSSLASYFFLLYNGNFRIIKFSRNFAVCFNLRILKSAKYFHNFDKLVLRNLSVCGSCFTWVSFEFIFYAARPLGNYCYRNISTCHLLNSVTLINFPLLYCVLEQDTLLPESTG